MVGREYAQLVAKAPGYTVDSKGRAFPTSADAWIGYTNIPVALQVHHPKVRARVHTVSGHDLGGTVEAGVV